MCAYLKDDSQIKRDERWVCHHKCSRERFVYPNNKACKWMDVEEKERELVLKGAEFNYVFDKCKGTGD